MLGVPEIIRRVPYGWAARMAGAAGTAGWYIAGRVRGVNGTFLLARTYSHHDLQVLG